MSIVSLDSNLNVVDAVLSGALAKFEESVDVAINTNVGKKNGTFIKTYMILPHSVSASLKVAVFTDDSMAADEAKSAGASIVGGDEFLDGLLRGDPLGFDVIVSSANMMTRLSKAAKILGPKGLMPSAKLGTLTDKIGAAVREIMAGRVYLKSDDHGTIHLKVGKVYMSAHNIIDNLRSVVEAVNAAGASTKNFRIKSMFISSTMGKGYPISVATLVSKKGGV